MKQEKCLVKGCDGKLETLKENLLYCNKCKRDHFKDPNTGKIKLVPKAKL